MMRTKNEILRALEIVTTAAVSSAEAGKINESACVAAMALGWVVKWHAGSTDGVDEFQAMLDQCEALDKRRGSHSHSGEQPGVRTDAVKSRKFVK